MLLGKSKETQIKWLRTGEFMNFKGDTEKQAILRDKIIKKGKKLERSIYFSKILSFLKPKMRVLDIGCGTAHIIQELAIHCKSAIFLGLDISPAMLKIASLNTKEVPNIRLVEGDGLELPFPECTFNIVMTRLAEYSPKEAYRILKKRGIFFQYGLGPEANKEIMEFFPNRIEKENFFIPRNMEQWKEEACKTIKDADFSIISLEDYKEYEYYQGEEEIMDLIEMVPLVKNFDRKMDRKKVKELAEKYRENKIVKITWHYYIVEAIKA